MRIAADGKVGIGTTTANKLLEVNGTLNVTGIHTMSDSINNYNNKYGFGMDIRNFDAGHTGVYNLWTITFDATYATVVVEVIYGGADNNNNNVYGSTLTAIKNNNNTVTTTVIGSYTEVGNCAVGFTAGTGAVTVKITNSSGSYCNLICGIRVIGGGEKSSGSGTGLAFTLTQA